MNLSLLLKLITLPKANYIRFAVSPQKRLSPAAGANPLFSVPEIYRIVSQKQITDSGDSERPMGGQAITLQPTETENKEKKNCCN